MTWNYGDLLKVFSNNKSSTQSYRVTKEAELGKLLDIEKIRDKGCLQLVEIVVGRDDAPPALRRALGIKPQDNNSKMHKKIGDISMRQGLLGW